MLEVTSTESLLHRARSTRIPSKDQTTCRLLCSSFLGSRSLQVDLSESYLELIRAVVGVRAVWVGVVLGSEIQSRSHVPLVRAPNSESLLEGSGDLVNLLCNGPYRAYRAYYGLLWWLIEDT